MVAIQKILKSLTTIGNVTTIVITSGKGHPMQVKLRKVGNSIGTSFPKEVLDRLGLKDGDTLELIVNNDGIQLIAHDPNFDTVMAAYKTGASQYRNALRELADG
jgi:putative addiction module antidote